MARFSEEVIARAREMDLLTYLQIHEPGELVKRGSGEYTTKTHDSLKISNGKWMWWSRNIGGYTALDYLVKVKGIPFREAVNMIVGQAVERPPASTSKRVFSLPKKCNSNNQMIAYLKGRGIDEEIIKDCIAEGMIYESYPYHNVVFIGKDEEGKIRNASFRSCNERRIMGEVAGSEKQYAFRLLAEDMRCIQVFESAIDLLSYATLLKKHRYNYREYSLVSLSGIFIPKEDGEMTLPKVLEHLLSTHQEIKKIVFHLDNDEPGRKATEGLMKLLQESYEVKDSPPLCGKDYNDYLQMFLESERNGRDERS